MTEKKVINSKPNKIALVAIVIFCITIFFGGFFLIHSQIPKTFRLEDELYAKSEAIDIKKEDYEKLISEKKSFIIMVDKPDCYTTANMRKYMSGFPDDMQFKYYRIMWEDAKESSLHEYVKFVPSVAIIYKGQVKQWLQADRDEDTKYFENADDLKEWSHKYIEF